MELTHEELRKLLGAYALDAVLPEEREAIERHLRECPACRGEVADHLETAALLGGGGAPAPAGVWDRIAASLGAPGPGIASSGTRPARSLRWWVTGIAAAAVVATVAVLGFLAVRQGDRIDRLASASERHGIVEGALAAMLDPDRRVVELRSPDSEASADVVLLADGLGYLVRDTLRPSGSRRTYQLWALVGERKISAGVLGSDPGLTPVRAPSVVEGLAITEERSGGARSPHGSLVVVGRVEAS